MTAQETQYAGVATDALRQIMDNASRFIQDLQAENRRLLDTNGQLRIRLGAYENPETGEPYGNISRHR